MGRWNEDQDRWMARGDRYGEDERRFRGERGEEGGWRSRDWRDEDRFEGWRGRERGSEWDERGGGWGERGERAGGRGGERGGRWGERGGGWGERGEERWTQGGREPYGGGMYRGRGDYPPYEPGPMERWREDPRRDYGEMRRSSYEPRHEYGEERGRFERMGERIREGVRRLTGHAPKGYRRSDERIHEDVCERIARSWINAENVEVKVENGEVTLTGFVERREDKRVIEDIADDVFGVEEVHNHLRVSRGEQQPASGSTGASIPAGTGTTGTGLTMSAQQAGTRSPSQGQPPGRR